MKKSILALLLAALLTLSACGGDTPADTHADTTTPETTAAPVTEAPAVDLTLIEAGKPLVTVMRPEAGTTAEVEAAMSVHALLTGKSASSPKITTDWIKPGGNYDENAVELLIGRTGQPASTAVYADLGYGEFRIKVSGSKLVVAAWTADALNEAVAELRALVQKHMPADTLTLPADLDVRGVVDATVNALPTYTAGQFGYIQPVGDIIGDSAMQVTVEKTTREEYAAYRATLEADGYAVVQENSIGENRYVTLQKGEVMVTAYHMGLLSRTRLIVEGARPIAQENTPYTAVCDTTLWQMGLDANNPDLDSSMNVYAVQLADGRFVLVDTGEEEAAKYQIAYMKEHTPAGQKPTVAAVIITHPHVDHMNGLLKMASSYRNELDIEAVYLNYGSFDMQSRYVLSTFQNHWKKAQNAAAAFGADFYIMRTGQRIELADAVFEVLWTPEDFGTTIIEDYNNACVVTRMTVGDTTTMFMGDCRDLASPIVVQMYGKALKSDIITVAHHGYGGSVTALYEAVSAAHVLWPNLYFDEREVNRKLLAMECVEKHYLAADGDVILTLVDRP